MKKAFIAKPIILFFGAPRRIRTLNDGSEDRSVIHYTMDAYLTPKWCFMSKSTNFMLLKCILSVFLRNIVCKIIKKQTIIFCFYFVLYCSTQNQIVQQNNLIQSSVLF